MPAPDLNISTNCLNCLLFGRLRDFLPYARVVRLRCKTHIFETDLLILAFALSQAYLVECKGNRLSRQASRNAMVGYEKSHHAAAG